MSENDQKKKGFFSSGLSALKDAAEKAAPIAQKAFDDAKQYAKDTAIPSITPEDLASQAISDELASVEKDRLAGKTGCTVDELDSSLDEIIEKA